MINPRLHALIKWHSAPAHCRSLTIASLFFLSNMAFAAPSGEYIAGGQATIKRPDAHTTVVQQSTARVAIEWDQFSLGAAERIIFKQPNQSSLALNRVVGVHPSRILGRLVANGQVILSNPNGIFFGQNARLDVAGLIGTTLHISNTDFMQGNMAFSRVLGLAPASVVNAGELVAKNGGYIILAGDHVDNQGIIQANLGRVVLAASQRMTLDLVGDHLIQFEIDKSAVEQVSGAVNTGTLLAEGGSVLMTAALANDLLTTAVRNDGVIRAQSIVEHNGEIILSAFGGDVIHSGTLDVSGSDDVDGGLVQVLGTRVGLIDNARIDASGQNGGEILIGGDYQGQGTVPTAQVTHVGADVALYADAISTTGNGGKIILWADGDTRFAGQLSATGGSLSGHGGFAEVSGKQGLIFTGGVDLSAINGTTGTLLLDPLAIAIVNIAESSPNTFSPEAAALMAAFNPLIRDTVVTDLTGTPSDGQANIFAFSENPTQNVFIDADIITGLLSAGQASVILQAESVIVVDEAIINPDGGSLKLQTNGDIGIFAEINLGTGAASLRLEAGNDIIIGDNVITDGDIKLTAVHDIVVRNGAQLIADNDASGDGNIVFQADSGAIGIGNVTTDAGTVLQGFNVVIRGEDLSLAHTATVTNTFQALAQQDVTLSGTNTAAASIFAEADAGTVTITNDLTAGSNITVTALLDISITNAAQIVANTNPNGPGNTLLIADSSSTGLGGVTTDAGTGLQAFNIVIRGEDLSLAHTSVTTNTFQALAGQDVTLFGTNTAAGLIIVEADSGSVIIANDLTAGSDISITAFRDISITNAAQLLANTNPNNSGNALFIADSSGLGAGTVNIQVGTSVNAENTGLLGQTLDVAGKLFADDDIALVATDGVTIRNTASLSANIISNGIGDIILFADAQVDQPFLNDLFGINGVEDAANIDGIGDVVTQSGATLTGRNVFVLGANAALGRPLDTDNITLSAAQNITQTPGSIQALDGGVEVQAGNTVTVSDNVIATDNLDIVSNGNLLVLNRASLVADSDKDGFGRLQLNAGAIDAQVGTLLGGANASLFGNPVVFDQTDIAGEFLINNVPFGTTPTTIPPDPIIPITPDPITPAPISTPSSTVDAAPDATLDLPSQDELFQLSDNNPNPVGIQRVDNTSIDRLQEAIAEGEDPTEILEATAAGEEEEDEEVLLVEQPWIEVVDQETGLVCLP